MAIIGQFVHDETGQDVVEYGLLIASISLCVLLFVVSFGSGVEAWWGNLATPITSTSPTAAGCVLPPGAVHASQSGLTHGHGFECP
jgi:Flp pilus assembly pilin Flp